MDIAIQPLLAHFPNFDFQVYPLLLLQITGHRKQVARLGISFRPEHAHETLARLVEYLGEFLEPHRRVDIITQYCLAGIEITREQTGVEVGNADPGENEESWIVDGPGRFFPLFRTVNPNYAGARAAQPIGSGEHARNASFPR